MATAFEIAADVARVIPRIKVDTKIVLRPDAVPGVANKLRASTLRLVPVAPPEDLLKEALETTKHTADVLAQQALGLKRRARR